MTNPLYPPRNTDSPAIKVKPERTEWREKDFSLRHRMWSAELTATDVDFLEYNWRTGEPVALLEIKKATARDAAPPDAKRDKPNKPENSGIRAQRALAERAGVPLFGVRYAHDFSWFYVAALSKEARRLIPERINITERAFVKFLLWLRAPKKRIDLERCGGGIYRTSCLESGLDDDDF